VVHAVEDAVGGASKSVHLQLDQVRWKLSYQVVECGAERGVVRHEHVGLVVRLLFILVLSISCSDDIF